MLNEACEELFHTQANDQDPISHAEERYISAAKSFLDSNLGEDVITMKVVKVAALGVYSIPTLVAGGQFMFGGQMHQRELIPFLTRVADMCDEENYALTSGAVYF